MEGFGFRFGILFVLWLGVHCGIYIINTEGMSLTILALVGAPVIRDVPIREMTDASDAYRPIAASTGVFFCRLLGRKIAADLLIAGDDHVVTVVCWCGSAVGPGLDVGCWHDRYDLTATYVFGNGVFYGLP
jgi:hypothetical protein